MNIIFNVNMNREITVSSAENLPEQFLKNLQEMNDEYKEALMKIDVSNITLNNKDLKNTLAGITALKEGEHYYILKFDKKRAKYFQQIKTYSKSMNKNNLKELAKRGRLTVDKKKISILIQKKNHQINKMSRIIFTDLLTKKFEPSPENKKNLNCEL